MAIELRILALFLRSVTQLLAAVPDGDPLRASKAWRQVARQVHFLEHLIQDVQSQTKGRV